MHHSPFVINAIASMANVYDVWLCCAAACRRAGAAMYLRPGTPHKGAVTSFGPREEVVFHPDHVDERVDGIQIAEAEPAPPQAFGVHAVPHRLLDDPR